MKYGLVFKDSENTVWIGEFSEDKTISDFGTITDDEQIYEKLPLDRVMLVTVERYDEFAVIQDLSMFAIGSSYIDNPDEQTDTVITEFLAEAEFPSDITNSVFAALLEEINENN